MWKPLPPIANNVEDYFFKTKISDNDEIQFFLTDLKHLWKSKKETKNEIVKKAKELNKRIEFDHDKVIDTIRTIPSAVDLQEDLSHLLNNLIIKKKYYLSGRPFVFHWVLSSCDRNEFKQLITIPALVSLNGLKKQNEELLKIIEKKDIEINQYKLEGCVLVRSSVATQPVDADNFKKIDLFMMCDKKLKKFEEICKDDLEDDTKKNVDETLNEALQPVDTTLFTVKSKKKRLLKKQKELAEKRLCIADNKITYYESPSSLEGDAECYNNEIEFNSSAAGLVNNVENTNGNYSNNLEIEQIKISLAELKQKSDILLQEPK